MSETNLVTIPDIARHAGVGTATVDRVMNGRPGVNAETTKKVLQALEALGTPVMQRGRPRLKKNLRFAYVLPKGQAKFFDLLERRIALQAGEFRHQNITEVTYSFDAEDPDHFAKQLMTLEDFAGIAVLAPDVPAVKQVINAKVKQGIHVVTLLSDVAGSMREVYVGPDNRAAGRTAGLLLARMAEGGGRDTMLLLNHPTRLSSDTDRRFGFIQKIEEDFKHFKVVRTPDLSLDDEAVYKEVSNYLKADIDPLKLAGIYGTGGLGTVGVVAALKDAGLLGRVAFTVHDLTEVHQSCLSRGEVTYVLDQDTQYCVSAAAKVLRGLCENVRGAVQVPKPRVEILTAENYH